MTPGLLQGKFNTPHCSIYALLGLTSMSSHILRQWWRLRWSGFMGARQWQCELPKSLKGLKSKSASLLVSVSCLFPPHCFRLVCFLCLEWRKLLWWRSDMCNRLEQTTQIDLQAGTQHSSCGCNTISCFNTKTHFKQTDSSWYKQWMLGVFAFVLHHCGQEFVLILFRSFNLLTCWGMHQRLLKSIHRK